MTKIRLNIASRNAIKEFRMSLTTNRVFSLQ